MAEKKRVTTSSTPLNQYDALTQTGDSEPHSQSHHHNQAAYAQRLSQLSNLLTATQDLWQVVAFDCQQLPWQQRFPLLADTVANIADENIDALDNAPDTLLALLLPSLEQDMQASPQANITDLLPLLGAKMNQSLATQADVSLDDAGLSHFSAHIKGRKWQQITAFTAQVFSHDDSQLPILEWCAGKGHLGRLIAKTQDRKVTSLEWQQALCQQGQTFADKWQLAQQFVCADAFADLAQDHNALPIKQPQHAVALHACGDLHVRLIRLASEVGTEKLSISPCCYHLIQSHEYQPLSASAKAAHFQLSRHDLQLPLQQSVIANDRQNALRKQEVMWRLGFDNLQRVIRQCDEYLPVPTIKQSQLSGSFEGFCRWAATQKQLVLPDNVIYDDYLQQGKIRQKLTQRIDLVRHLFRQAIEQWLLLDRVCYLIEHQYHVKLTDFCANEITPRNALIHAEKIHLV